MADDDTISIEIKVCPTCPLAWRLSFGLDACPKCGQTLLSYWSRKSKGKLLWLKAEETKKIPLAQTETLD